MTLRSSTRALADRLREVSTDHARCLRLAAGYRADLARGMPGMRARHAWALDNARYFRARHDEMMRVRASPG